MTDYSTKMKTHSNYLNAELGLDIFNYGNTKMTKYEVSTGTYKEDLLDFNIIKLINERRSNNQCIAYFDIDTSITQKNITDLISFVIKKTKIELPYSVHTKTCAEFYDDNIIIALLPNYDLRNLKIDAYGSPELIMKYKDIFSKVFKNNAAEIKMSWYYTNGRGFDSADIPIDITDTKINNSHYPFIKEGVNEFLDRYQNSSNAILLLTGEPGTGKTSFIRHYISTYLLDSIVTYDEQVMMRDDFYINFLTNAKKNVLIVEDADLLLSARDDGENKIMSKFLNVSDGLVKGLNKKIIFSTNITQLGRIDSAITRKGRCFDILEFRKLTRDEANVVSREHGLTEFEAGEEFTLADIFNRGPRTTIRRKFGYA